VIGGCQKVGSAAGNRKLLGGLAVAVASVVAACSSNNGVVGSSGPHTPQFSGTFAAFLRSAATPGQLQALEGQVSAVAMSNLMRAFTVGGVLVVALNQNSSSTVHGKVLNALKSSPAVDHVANGGCDIRMASCEQWKSSATGE
jgi:hypothetical protein